MRALYEDSKGNFWVGTAGDGLHIMDRATGKFQHFYYNAKNPAQLSRPPLKKNNVYDHITFIQEDVTGSMWIGTSESGLNYYNNRTQRVTHYESETDSMGSYKDYTAWWAYSTRDGILWISSTHGTLYRVNPRRMEIPFYQVDGRGTTTIYEMPDRNIWVGTRNDGLIVQDSNRRFIKKYLHKMHAPYCSQWRKDLMDHAGNE